MKRATDRVKKYTMEAQLAKSTSTPRQRQRGGVRKGTTEPASLSGAAAEATPDNTGKLGRKGSAGGSSRSNRSARSSRSARAGRRDSARSSQDADVSNQTIVEEPGSSEGNGLADMMAKPPESDKKEQ